MRNLVRRQIAKFVPGVEALFLSRPPDTGWLLLVWFIVCRRNILPWCPCHQHISESSGYATSHSTWNRPLSKGSSRCFH